MLSLLLAIAAVQAPAADAIQRLEPLACTAEPNYVTKERMPFGGTTFRFSGTVSAEALEAEDFTPFATLALLQQGRPEELSAVLSVQPATRRRFDVTLRRHINNELREREIIGRVPAGSIPFELSVGSDRMVTFRLGDVTRRQPLGQFQPDAIVLGCSSGSFRFDNLEFRGGANG